MDPQTCDDKFTVLLRLILAMPTDQRGYFYLQLFMLLILTSQKFSKISVLRIIHN